jgi:hypothetical protein
MPDNTSRLCRWCWLVAPILTAQFDRWQARRAKERRRAQAQAQRLASPETYAPPEREPRDVDSVFLRMTGRPRQPWEVFADELRAEQRALHQRISRHHTTSARDNFARPYPYDR